MYYRDINRVALEDALLRRAKQHDERVLAAIYEPYAPRIYAYIYRRVGDAMLAENLAGDVVARGVPSGPGRAGGRRFGDGCIASGPGTGAEGTLGSATHSH